MRKSRPKKRRNNEEDQIVRARRIFGPMLRALGLAEHFGRVPVHIQREIYLLRSNPPRVVFIDNAADGPEMEAIETQIMERLRETTVPSPSLGVSFSLRDVFYLLWTLFGASRSFSGSYPVNQDLAAIWRVSKKVFAEALPAALGTLGWLVDDVLIQHMRFDRNLLYHRVEVDEREAKAPRAEIRVFSEPPRQAEAILDGASRPVFQCGSAYVKNAIHWVAWNRDDPESCAGEHALPVCVQSHAIDRLCERIPFDDTNALVDSIYLSLLEPRICGRTQDVFLVEHRLAGDRLGYFPVTRVDDRFVVTTFLFLTMAETPEGKQIRQKLNVVRNGLETTGLDQLATFLETDILRDDALVRVLTECGCGHLFKLAEDVRENPELIPQASNIRRILGWPASDVRQFMGASTTSSDEGVIGEEGPAR